MPFRSEEDFCREYCELRDEAAESFKKLPDAQNAEGQAEIYYLQGIFMMLLQGEFR